jgi:hypothetical protein
MLVRASKPGWQAWLGQGNPCAHAEARMVFVKGTAWLGAIKDINLVPLFLLDLDGG